MELETLDIEAVVGRYYGDVYRFALSLARNSTEAADLTQQTFLRLSERGHQIREPGRAKSWLMTTVYREFNGLRRHADRFPHEELAEESTEIPAVAPEVVGAIDGATAMEALRQVDEVFRAPLSLFYLEDYSYQEIGEILGVPIGTVVSRLSRGKAQLKAALTDGASRDSSPSRRVIRMVPRKG